MCVSLCTVGEHVSAGSGHWVPWSRHYSYIPADELSLLSTKLGPSGGATGTSKQINQLVNQYIFI